MAVNVVFIRRRMGQSFGVDIGMMPSAWRARSMRRARTPRMQLQPPPVAACRKCGGRLVVTHRAAMRRVAARRVTTERARSSRTTFRRVRCAFRCARRPTARTQLTQRGTVFSVILTRLASCYFITLRGLLSALPLCPRGSTEEGVHLITPTSKALDISFLRTKS